MHHHQPHPATLPLFVGFHNVVQKHWHCTQLQKKLKEETSQLLVLIFNFQEVYILDFPISTSLCVSCLLAEEEIGRMSNFTGEWPGPFWINQSFAAKSWKSDWLSSSLSRTHFHHLLLPASQPYQPAATFGPFPLSENDWSSSSLSSFPISCKWHSLAISQDLSFQL